MCFGALFSIISRLVTVMNRGDYKHSMAWSDVANLGEKKRNESMKGLIKVAYF